MPGDDASHVSSSSRRRRRRVQTSTAHSFPSRDSGRSCHPSLPRDDPCQLRLTRWLTSHAGGSLPPTRYTILRFLSIHRPPGYGGWTATPPSLTRRASRGSDRPHSPPPHHRDTTTPPPTHTN